MKRRGEIAVVVLMFVLIVLILAFEAVYIYSVIFHQDIKITGWIIGDDGEEYTLVTIYPEQEVGRVRDDFYGINDGFFRLSDITKVDLDYDQVPEKLGDYEFHRDALDNANIKTISFWVDMYWLSGKVGTGSVGDGRTFDYDRIENLKREIRYLNESGKNIIINLRGGTPSALSNKSSPYCNASYYNSCPPFLNSSITDWYDDFIYNITDGFVNNYSMSFEIQNEPYGDSWLALASQDIKGEYLADYFSYIYNYTKPKYPFIKIGGCGFFTVHPEITGTFVSNLSSGIDFLSTHPYDYGSTNSLVQLNSTITLFSLCSTYGLNCSEVLLSEWTVGTSTIQRGSTTKNQYGQLWADSYQSLLNSYPENISSVGFQLATWNAYGSSAYTGYMYNWISQAGLNYYEDNSSNIYYPPYNVTKDFAHYHAVGNMIVNSSSSNESIRVVASLNPEEIWHITAIMVGSGESNLSIDVGSSGIEALMDLKTNEVYNVVNGTVDVGVIEQYGVKHYESTALIEKIIEEEIELSEEEILIEDETIDEGGETNMLDEVVQDNETWVINETMEITTKTTKKRNIFKTIFLWDTGDSTNLNLIEEGVTENNLSETENKTESLGEIIIDYITGASSTDDNYSKDKKHSSSGSGSPTETSEEGEALLTEGIESEVSESTNTTYTLSQALSNKGYMSIIIILLIGILVVGLIIKGIYKKKKHNAETIIKLNDWVKRAKALGYDYTKMKTMLEEKRWNRSLIEKALEENGMQREPLY